MARAKPFVQAAHSAVFLTSKNRHTLPFPFSGTGWNGTFANLGSKLLHAGRQVINIRRLGEGLSGRHVLCPSVARRVVVNAFCSEI
jgi:hypothetical protein